MKLYTLDNQFIKETDVWPRKFTGIVVLEGIATRWFVNGRLHRLDGPAVEWFHGDKDYYINDKWVEKEHFMLLTNMMKLKGLS